MPDYLLDCNHLSGALRKVSPVRERIHQGRRAGHRFISCYPVLCELEVGIQQTANPDDNRRRLVQLLRRLGRVLSQVDMLLAALARQHQLLVLTTDRDFEALTDLRIDNWAG
jgi:tRNA(fMet)-specific endonuclease VapC